MVLRPGADASSPDPSTGAHWTSDRLIGSRLLSASDSRPETSIQPTSRHSSVSPSNEMPRWPAPAALAGALPAGPPAAPDGLSRDLFRFRKSNGTSFLRGPAVGP